MTFIDFFAGIGGFRKGMELAGHKCIGFCENDIYAVASYTSMHLVTEEQRQALSRIAFRIRQQKILRENFRNGEWFADDIRRLESRDIPYADCWCFGAPCQSFSIAGNRTGLDGESGLVLEIFRLLASIPKENRPRYLFCENVKGMLSSNRGFDFLRILIEMDTWGYDVQWQVLNSKAYVPQNRERVFLIGLSRRYSTPKIFPLDRNDKENSFSVNPNRSENRFFMDKSFTPSALKTANTLTATENRGISNHNNVGTMICEKISVEQPSREILVKEPTEQGFAVATENVDAVNFARLGSPTARGMVGFRAAHTLDSDCCQGIFTSVPKELEGKSIWYDKEQCWLTFRRLTPRECFRLQGWSDEYYERAALVNSDAQLYKQAGNSVTIPLICDIGKRLTL